MRAIEQTVVHLGLNGDHFTIIGLRDALTIDGSNRTVGVDDIDINPIKNENPDDEQRNDCRDGPDDAALENSFFAVREMASPAENERFAITTSRDVRRLFYIFLIFGRARWPLGSTRCLTTHEYLQCGNPWPQKPKGGTILSIKKLRRETGEFGSPISFSSVQIGLDVPITCHAYVLPCRGAEP